MASNSNRPDDFASRRLGDPGLPADLSLGGTLDPALLPKPPWIQAYTRRRFLDVLTGGAAGTALGAFAGYRASTGQRGLRFEIFRDIAGEYRYRIRASNGNIIGTSGEGYKAKADCRHAVDLIQAGAAAAQVQDITGRK